MKHEKIDKKLTFKKETIALLNVDHMKNAVGGGKTIEVTCIAFRRTLTGCLACPCTTDCI